MAKVKQKPFSPYTFASLAIKLRKMAAKRVPLWLSFDDEGYAYFLAGECQVLLPEIQLPQLAGMEVALPSVAKTDTWGGHYLLHVSP